MLVLGCLMLIGSDAKNGCDQLMHIKIDGLVKSPQARHPRESGGP